jgi:SAM-dependent methyltransferase
MEAKHIPFLGAYPFYQRARSCKAPPTEKEMQAFATRADTLERVHPNRGKLLDLGMGDGAFLMEMQRRGWSVSGIDNEPDVVTYARNQLRVEDCFAADVEADPLPQGPLDAVTMWGLLQLTYQPQALLEKVRGVLTTDGVVAIGVSNFASAGAQLFGKHWKGLGLPRHLIHFEPDSLQRLLEQSGYEMVDLSFETPYWIAGASIQAAMPLPGILGRICRRSLGAMLGLVGRSRVGDTMTAIARVSR